MSDGDAQAPSGSPEDMRETVRAYVANLHVAYLDHVHRLPPGEVGRLPLVSASGFTVIAAAARRLHLIATTQPFPAPSGPEVELHDEHRGSRWSLRFYDPSRLPALGLIDDDQSAQVRQVLGVHDVVYHLTVDVGGGLTGHHAQHSGVALANRQTDQERDLERLRAHASQTPLVDELAVAVGAGLDRAAALLAAELTAGRVAPTEQRSARDTLGACVADLTAGGERSVEEPS